MTPAARFKFGQNWMEYATKALTADRIAQARADFFELIPEELLQGERFLDIGFGQGLAVCFACEAGAQKVIGVDIDPDCREALETTAQSLKIDRLPEVVIGSILDEATLTALKSEGPFAVVHSWGVLHHTGDMYEALKNAASLVSEGGHLVIAIYNKHWSSPLWKQIKFLYSVSPSFIQRLFIAVMYPIILIAKALVTKSNPFNKDRGMSFYYDVIDWVGGYPYEYASGENIIRFVKKFGFSVVNERSAEVPTGCNEFVFRKE